MSNLDKAHERLQVALSQEIALRQEILSNLNQQEYVLLIGDIELQEELSLENNALIHRLKTLIKERGLRTRELFDVLPPDTVGITLDEVLDPTLEVEAETLLLYEKARTLVKKIHDEHLRIKTLHEMIKREGALDVNNHVIHTHAHNNQGKGPTLITIDYPEGKEQK